MNGLNANSCFQSLRSVATNGLSNSMRIDRHCLHDRLPAEPISPLHASQSHLRGRTRPAA